MFHRLIEWSCLQVRTTEDLGNNLPMGYRTYDRTTNMANMTNMTRCTSAVTSEVPTRAREHRIGTSHLQEATLELWGGLHARSPGSIPGGSTAGNIGAYCWQVHIPPQFSHISRSVTLVARCLVVPTVISH